MASAPSLPIGLIDVRGTNYDVGHQMGQTFKSRIQEAANLQLVRDYDTPLGNEIYSSYLKVAEDVYPHYVRELQGIADGSGIPFRYLFLKLITCEYQSLLGDVPLKSIGGEGCTDLILNSEDQDIIVHCEDTKPDMANGYIVHAHIQPSDSNPREEKFVSYCDPGMLPGSTFAVNAHGIGMTNNRLYQKGITNKNAIARKLLNRALLSSENLEDTIRIIKTPPGIASAVNLNLVIKERGRGKASFYSIEISHSPDGSVIDVAHYKDGFSHYVNMYQRSNVDQIKKEGSIHRATRLQEFSKPKGMKDMLDMISDTSNTKYPIYRNCTPPDICTTACVGAYDVRNDRLYIFRENPRECHYQPVAVFNTQDLTQETFTTFSP
ncbi:beta-alanyl-dopamine/carcinine hydrolase-like [Ptychodera flava]|uniref:beta-alanyl-dopamine/carcinine hydrolase-like n=1 Tax=Ptychodera flava TaxID=63121 RepID=UPI003969D18D